METRWLCAVMFGFVVAAGCADDARQMPWSEPPQDDGVGGSAGEMFAGGGVGGSGAAGTGGSGGSTPIDACDPEPPATSMEDASTSIVDRDAGPDPVATESDAGVDPGPDPVTPDSGITTPTGPVMPDHHGALIVTELLIDPTILTDGVGEWIELRNTTATELELGGCVVSDDRTDDFVLAPWVVPAGGYVVLGRSEQAAPVVDQVYSGMVLANTTDEIVVTCSDVLIDRFAYGTGFPRHAGKTMQLDPSSLDAISNDMAAGWCDGIDSGTPGADNLPCVAE